MSVEETRGTLHLVYRVSAWPACLTTVREALTASPVTPQVLLLDQAIGAVLGEPWVIQEVAEVSASKEPVTVVFTDIGNYANDPRNLPVWIYAAAAQLAGLTQGRGTRLTLRHWQ